MVMTAQECLTVAVRPAETLAELAHTANSAAARGTESLCVAGDALLKAKKMVPHGEWTNWLLKNWHYSAQHARRLMRAAEVPGRHNADNVLTSIASPPPDDDTRPIFQAPSKGTSCSLLERNENRPTVQTDHTNGYSSPTNGKAELCVYEEVEIPEDPTLLPPPPPARRVIPAPPPRPPKPRADESAMDMVLSAITRLNRRLTVFINETEEGEKLVAYMAYHGLKWVDHRDITVKGRTFGKRFVGLRDLRLLIGFARRPKKFNEAQIKQLMGELDPEGDE